jgi:diguanylate cyclase (GGDEF)-like protein/PAS domain S-box-containing protein
MGVRYRILDLSDTTASAGQIALQKLLDTLMRTLIEKAGARQGNLILVDEAELVLVAKANMEQQGVGMPRRREPSTPGPILPESMLDYVRRNREQVLLGNARQPHPFSADPYFTHHRPKSVLCLPIFLKDELICLLYLENNLIMHAFTPERVRAVELLASQAAILLECSQLYTDLHREGCQGKPVEKISPTSEQTFNQLFDVLPTAVYVCDASGVIESYNRSAVELWGRAPKRGDRADRFCGSYRILTPDGIHIPHGQCPVAQVLRTGISELNREVVFQRPDGSRRTAMVNIVPRRDMQGNITGAINCMTDITERNLAEEELRAREAEIRRLVDANIIGVFFWDMGGGISEANDAFLQIVGYSRQDLLAGKVRWTDMTAAKYRAADEQALVEARRVGIFTPLEKEFIRKDGGRVSVLVGGALFEGSQQNGVGFVLDLTEQKRAQERVSYMAHHDTLTGLANRILLQDRMKQAITHAHRNRTQMAVLFIDLDHFKHINDSLGHVVGDHLLQAVAIRLRNCLREDDSLARLGGDEFVLMLATLNGSDDAALVAQKVLNALGQPFDINGHELHVSGSIGISLYPYDGTDVEMLMRTADTAMYHAKQQGRRNYQFFTAALNDAARQRFDIERQLRQALARDEFALHYQPQIDIESGTILAAEALLRWQPSGRAAVSGGEFISIAEETGLIMPIGEWVLREACRQLKRWHNDGYPDLKIAVNLSARQFYQPNFSHTIRKILNETELPASALDLEITETTLMRSSKDNIAALKQLSAMGVQLSVDDFGTGYSSLAYLQRFPVHALKIDQSFVRGIGTDSNDTALVTAIIAMTKSLNLKVMAEGVETAHQAKFLQSHGCPVAQGFYYSKAVSARAFSDLLQSAPSGAGFLLQQSRVGARAF